MATKKFVAKERAALMTLMDDPPFRIPHPQINENIAEELPRKFGLP